MRRAAGVWSRASTIWRDLRSLSQSERMQHVLRLLETRDYVQVAELSEAFSVSEVTVRSDLTELAPRRASSRASAAACGRFSRAQSEVGFDLRLRLEVERKRAIARAAAAMVGRRRGDRARREHDRLLPRARAAGQARARRRHERAARRDRARRRPDDHRDRHRRGAPALGDVARRRPRHRRAAHDADQQGLPRRARPQPRARPDGPEPRRGADQAGDGRTPASRSTASSTARSGTAARCSRSSRRGADGHRHRLERARTAEVEAWRAAGVDVVAVDPGPREPLPRRPRDLRRAMRHDEAAG